MIISNWLYNNGYLHNLQCSRVRCVNVMDTVSKAVRKELFWKNQTKIKITQKDVIRVCKIQAHKIPLQVQSNEILDWNQYPRLSRKPGTRQKNKFNKCFQNWPWFGYVMMMDALEISENLHDLLLYWNWELTPPSPTQLC